MRFTQRLRRVLWFFFLAYAGLFCARLGYGYLTYPVNNTQEEWYSSSVSAPDMITQTKKNYATQKQSVVLTGTTRAIDQKFEKTASVVSSTRKFKEDEAKVRDLILEEKGIIQDESANGNTGNRQLHLIIGVAPEKFDTFYEKALQIGRISSTSVNKQDKTNDYLALKAKRTSLESTLASLVELKKHDGKIEEFIRLQEQIKGIEQELQELGVSLGDFDETNAFCTVRLSLFEEQQYLREAPSLWHRATVAFVWATEAFVLSVSTLCLTLFTAFLLLVVIDRLKAVQKLVDKFNT